MRDLHGGVTRELPSQPSCDLLGRPAQSQLGFHQSPESMPLGELGLLGAAPALVGGCIGRGSSVAVPAAVAGDLAGDGRRRSAQPLGELPGRFPRSDTAGYLLTLAATQMPLRTRLRHEADAAALVQEPTGVLHRIPERPPDQAERLSLTPAPPDFILLSWRKPVVTHLCLHDHMIIRGWCVDHLRVPRRAAHPVSAPSTRASSSLPTSGRRSPGLGAPRDDSPVPPDFRRCAAAYGHSGSSSSGAA